MTLSRASTTRSKSGASLGSSTATARPVSSISAQVRAPMKRGSLWVAPPLGIRPTVTSGSAIRTPRRATRACAASTRSAAPQSAAPVRAATTGLGASSIMRASTSIHGAASGASNSERSTPAEKKSPAPESTTAETDGSAIATFSLSRSCWRNCGVRALPGGPSSIRKATPASIRSCTRTCRTDRPPPDASSA